MFEYVSKSVLQCCYKRRSVQIVFNSKSSSFLVVIHFIMIKDLVVIVQQDIEMETSTGGGVASGLKRVVTGESFFISDFTQNSETESGTVAFTSTECSFSFSIIVF